MKAAPGWRWASHWPLLVLLALLPGHTLGAIELPPLQRLDRRLYDLSLRQLAQAEIPGRQPRG